MPSNLASNAIPPLLIGTDESGAAIVVADWLDQPAPPPTDLLSVSLRPLPIGFVVEAVTNAGSLVIGPLSPEEASEIAAAKGFALLASIGMDVRVIGRLEQAPV